MLLLDSSRIDVLPLTGRSFHYKPLAATGDREIGQIIGWLHEMLDAEVQLMDHVQATVAALSRTHTCIVVTKGDLVDQERIKAELKHGVLILNLPKKDAPTYADAVKSGHRSVLGNDG